MTLPLGTDLRTLITVAVVVPVVTFTALGFAKLLARIFQRWSTFTARVARGLFVETLNGALLPALTEAFAPRFDHMETKFDEMSQDNQRAHTEVTRRLAGHDEHLRSIDEQLESINDRLALLESRRRDDRER